MSVSLKVVHEGGLTFEIANDNEPRVRDIELGERAGLAKPTNIRKLISDNWAELEILGDVETRHFQNAVGQNGSIRTLTEYWLNEHQAATLLLLMRTKNAREFRGQVVRTFIAVRRGLVAIVPPPVVLDSVAVNSARIRDNMSCGLELRHRVKVCMLLHGYTRQKLYGYLRRQFRVPSPFDVSTHLMPLVRASLEAVERGDISLGRAKALLTASTKQLAWRWS